MIEIALSCIRRGWYVFPCWPETKKPMTLHGWKDAANDEATIRAWWSAKPNANVAIACNPSNLVVQDIDHGLTSEDDLTSFLGAMPLTYAVRTGRRPEFGVQLYYAGNIRDIGEWKAGNCSGQVKSSGGYVMAAGSIHPDSKVAYSVLWDIPIAPAPGYLAELLAPAPKERVRDDGGLITENRNVRLTSIAGKLRNAGLSYSMLEVALQQVNADRCIPPLDDAEVTRIAANVARYDLPEDQPTVVLGAPTKLVDNVTEPVDWREHYHTLEEIESAPPVTYLIEDFLPDESIAGLAAPAGQRKSLIALNVAHALCTGEPLFGKFAVTIQPSRVLYLCPEMGIRAFTDRLRKIGLLPYVGKTLFCRTMSKPGMLELVELQPEEVNGAVVILDTAIRYLKGDENSSEHMRKFAASVFKISEMGAAAVLVLHHSAKGTKESGELTLENSMRGSGELGAFLTTCWATRLQDPTEPYKSASYLTNVKQRDFASTPFEVTGKDTAHDCRLWYVETDGPVTLRARSVFKGNKDGKDEAAKGILKSNPNLGERPTVELLESHGIKRGRDWVRKARAELSQANGGLMPSIQRP